MKRPSAVRALTAPIAAPFVAVGRIIEQIGHFFRLRNGHGSGMIRSACNNSVWLKCRSTKVTVDLLTGTNTVSVVLVGFPLGLVFALIYFFFFKQKTAY